MWKRVVAAVVALVLAVVGIVLVVTYANNADRRALEGLEPQEVLVAIEDIPQGTSVEELGERVELRAVPSEFVISGAVSDLEELEGQVMTASLGVGEQISRGRFSTPEDIRARGQAELPEGVEDLHQVTIALEKSRALGGNVVLGDTVGVFMSFDVDGEGEYVLDEDGSVTRVVAEGQDNGDDSVSISTTHLSLHKVPVVRVDGGSVVAPEESDEEAPALDTVNVTLALSGPQAEQLVFAMEFGSVWLSLEPAAADEDGTGVVVATMPNEARNVFE